MMSLDSARTVANLSVASALAICLGACSGMSLTGSSPSASLEPGVAPEMPATIRADEIVGKWGLASYQNLADQATPQELRLKGSQGGKNYIGPAGPAGGEQDREVVSFDGRVLITRFMDKDAATRYGNMVYVRCGARA